jgi:RimJ/RimL family protein N-acetyltransferase
MPVVEFEQSIASRSVRLELLSSDYLTGLRVACAADPDIWDIYPHSMLDEHFDPAVKAMLSHPNRIVFAALALSETAEKIVGMTSFINPDVHGVVEIGGTYIEPSVRGTGFNHAMKKLMIDHAFSCGYRRIEFRVDTRNQRSAAAVRKLGAQLDGVLRKNVVTWTGYVRDTYVFSLFEDEWRG